MIVSRSQRWRDRRDSFVEAAGEIDPRTLAVDVVDDHRVAKPFVERHHYSASFPASRKSMGLFRNGPGGASELVGVATFSVPINNASVLKRTGLDDHLAAADLGRFVLLDDVPGNAETFFLKRAFSLLRREKPGILSVISYADPMTRRSADGSLVKPGHIGRVYQMMGAEYRGRADPRSETVAPNGTILSERAIAKIRSGDTGHAYAIDQLVRLGAEGPGHADPKEWLASLQRSGFLQRRRHPGNHVYVWPRTMAAKIASRGLPHLAYPMLDRSPVCDDVTAPPLLAAA